MCVCLCLAGLGDFLCRKKKLKRTHSLQPQQQVEVLSGQVQVLYISSAYFIFRDEVEGGYEPPAAAGFPFSGLGVFCHHLHTLVLLLWSWQQLGTSPQDQGTLG